MVFTHSLYTVHYSSETGRGVEAIGVDDAIAYAKLTSTLPLACRQSRPWRKVCHAPFAKKAGLRLDYSCLRDEYAVYWIPACGGDDKYLKRAEFMLKLLQLPPCLKRMLLWLQHVSLAQNTHIEKHATKVEKHCGASQYIPRTSYYNFLIELKFLIC